MSSEKDSQQVQKKFDHISVENIDNLTESELLDLERKWKTELYPKWKLMMLVPYNIIMCGCAMYYTINFKYYSKKFFKPTEYSLKEIVKYGTLQSTVFVGAYVVGSYLITGFSNPITYLRGLAQIQGKIIDNQIRFDEGAQNHFLFGMMSYFGVSNDLIEKTKNDLTEQKIKLEQKNYFMKNDDDELVNKNKLL